MVDRIESDHEDLVDIEEYVAAGRKIPKAKKYRIRIDKQKYVVDVPEMTGREILELAGKAPVEQFALYQKVRGGPPEKRELDDTIDFRAPGIERFLTLPLDQTEGESPRREVRMPEDDMEFLGSVEGWEGVVENGKRLVFIYGVSVPDTFNEDFVAACFRIETAYPDTQIDMVYFHPALTRKDGRAIPATTMEGFDGKSWQRWSRHRTARNPWRPGVDNLATHFALVKEWLDREASRR